MPQNAYCVQSCFMLTMRNMNTTMQNPIRRYLEASGMSQRELAAQMKVSQATVGDWSTGKKLPRTTKIKKLAKILGTSQATLLLELHLPRGE